MTVTIVNRTYFSIQYIQSAAYFARSCAAIEKTHDGKYSEELFTQHRAYVIGAIFGAVSFLEATVNELFKDTVENPHGPIKELKRDAIERMATMWKLQVERQSILNKFQIALLLAHKKVFDIGKEPYQSVNLLVELRNTLVHYKPEPFVVL